MTLTACLPNLCHAPYVKHLPRRWKMLLAYLLTDEAYAVTIIHYRQRGAAKASPAASENDVTPRHWYFLGAGLTLWIVWQISTAIGIVLGANVPASWSLDFALPLTFIALVIPALRTRGMDCRHCGRRSGAGGWPAPQSRPARGNAQRHGYRAGPRSDDSPG